MLGVLITILICIAAVGWGSILLRRFTDVLDPAAKFGVAGLVGLGTFGTLIFFIGLFTTSVLLGLGVIFLVGGSFFLWRELKGQKLLTKPEGADLLFPLIIALALLMSLAGVLAPSTMNDWDSIAYHLAVPKMWLADGKIHPVSFIHQSNFPFAVDSLFLLGLEWGAQAAAKMFVWCFTLLGVIAIFGLARQRYGQRAGWWAALAFSTVPIVLWQSGTAYIDVANGLYAGLGLIFACWWLESDDTEHAWLSGILLGFAAASKYTGLQAIAVTGLIALVGAILLKRSWKPAFLIGLAALAVACPWYIKNVVWKQNPVFPFFYSKLGGKDWDQRRAEIYTNEQNTFGVGREKPPEGSIQPQRLGHSVLGLAYQPGRYVNPFQDRGGGDPMGAVGIAILGALALGLFAGHRGKFEKAILAAVLLNLLIWFVLTQQSRYIVALAVPLSLIAAQLTLRRGFALLMAGMVGIQTLASLYLVHHWRFSDQMLAVTGKVTPEEFQRQQVGFYGPAQVINGLGKQAKVALYDEVFGYFLDVPYYWANPGHSTEIPYDSMSNGKDYADAMKKMGFTHAYLNLSPGIKGKELSNQFIEALQGQPLPEEAKKQLMDSWQQKFNPLILDAVQSGYMTVEQGFDRPRAVLLRFN